MTNFRTELSDKHTRVLRALASSPAGAMRSTHAAERAGLSASELQMACKWLKRWGYVTGKLKTVKVPVGPRMMARNFSYWSLTDKGRETIEAQRVVSVG